MRPRHAVAHPCIHAGPASHTGGNPYARAHRHSTTYICAYINTGTCAYTGANAFARINRHRHDGTRADSCQITNGHRHANHGLHLRLP